MAATYSKRGNVFDKGEREWRITDDALIARDASGEDIGPWADITAVRLAYAPTRAKIWRYLIELKFRNGAKWTIDNVHFKGIGDFEDRSETFAPFAREVAAIVRQKAPSARATAGASPVGYWVNVAFLLLVFAFLVWILLLVDFDIPGIAFVKLVIILISLPVLFNWVVRARPRPMKLDDIPADALPKGG